MNKDFRLSKHFLDNLSDEELYLLINIVPKEQLLASIKKHPKKFKNETKGCRIDKDSRMLMDRLSNIYFNRMKKSDIDIINILNEDINFVINVVNRHIFEVTSNKDFFQEVISSNNINAFDKLINIMLDQLKPEYIKIFFELTYNELSNEQNNYIDTQIETIMLKRKLREEISKELEEQYISKVRNIKNDYKKYSSNQDKIIKEIKEKLNTMDIRFFNEKNNSNLLKNEIKKINIEKKSEIDYLQKHINKLNCKIDKIEEENFTLKDNVQCKEFTIQNLEKQLNMKYDEYSFKAQEKWNSENKKLLSIQKNCYEECENLERVKMMLNSSIKVLKNERTQLEKKVSECRSIVSRFIENIDEKLIEKALYDSLVNLNTNNFIQASNNRLQKGSDLYIKDNIVEKNIEKCKNIHDFSENIAVNLENIGIKDSTDKVANYIIGILAAGMTPLICGYKSREIATSISISYSGETPYIITLPNGYTNSKQLLEIYNSAKSNVVLIEDAVGTMNENALMPLLREREQKGFVSKVLLLSTENIDSVKYMPFNLFNQIALVMINKYGVNKNNHYEISNAQKVMKEFSLINEFEKEYKIIKKLTYDLKLGSPYEILRAIIVAYSQELSNSKAAFEGYLNSELMFIGKCNNVLVDLEKNIQKHQLGESLLEIVRGGLNG